MVCYQNDNIPKPFIFKVPSSQNGNLEEAVTKINLKVPNGKKYHFGKQVSVKAKMTLHQKCNAVFFTGILDFGYKKTPATFEVTSVCKRIESCGEGMI